MPSLTVKSTFIPSTIFSFGSALGDSRQTNLENDNTSQTEQLILFHENQAINAHTKLKFETILVFGWFGFNSWIRVFRNRSTLWLYTIRPNLFVHYIYSLGNGCNVSWLVRTYHFLWQVYETCHRKNSPFSANWMTHWTSGHSFPVKKNCYWLLLGESTKDLLYKK